MTEDFNFINFANTLKSIQKQIGDIDDSLRSLLKIQKANAKGARLKRYLTIEEVSELLEVHRNTVYRYIRSGELSTTMVGRQLYVHEDDVLVLFDRNRR